MPRATCRCGQDLPIPADPAQRVVCKSCGAKVRIRTRKSPNLADVSDGFIRFFCDCGRRLKVSIESPPATGKCPDCGAVVPVPAASLTQARPTGHPESPTEDLAVADREALARWASGRRSVAAPPTLAPAATAPNGVEPTMAFTRPPSDRVEVGLRICPNCGQPIHMGADACRTCGIAVPRR